MTPYSFPHHPYRPLAHVSRPESPPFPASSPRLLPLTRAITAAAVNPSPRAVVVDL
jgi:hypothetical protein